MNAKQIVLSLVLADFAAFNAWVLYDHGLWETMQLAVGNTVTLAIVFDLTIALTMVVAFLWADARRRGATILPYAMLTPLLGSAAPLMYLIRRESKQAA